MGYIQESNTKKIYAYLTQAGKEKFITGETKDFQVKYFSLHDDDINYYVASKMITSSTYNTLKSGFVADITGDNDLCSTNISDATLLRNKLLYFPPVVYDGDNNEYYVNGTCSIEQGKEETFEITVSKTGLFEGYTWTVKTDTISFPNSDSTINEAIVLKSTTSEPYDFQPISTQNGIVGYKRVNFNATCKFKVSDGAGGFTTVLLGEDFLPRKADSFNFTVEVKDTSGQIVYTKKFEDINCTKKIFIAAILPSSKLEESDNEDYVYNSPITDTVLKDIAGNSDVNLPFSVTYNPLNGNYLSATALKTGFALWVVDNGNRRRDLNVTLEDLDDPELKAYFNYSLTLQPYEDNITWQPAVKCYPEGVCADLKESNLVFNIQFDDREYNQNEFYPNTSGSQIITKPDFLRGPLMPNQVGIWCNDAPTITYQDNYASVRPTGYDACLYSSKYDMLHPTVEIFDNWKAGNEGFAIRYYEFVPVADEWPVGSTGANVYSWKAYTRYRFSLKKTGGNSTNNRLFIQYYNPEITGIPIIVGENFEEFTFNYCYVINQLPPNGAFGLCGDIVGP